MAKRALIRFDVNTSTSASSFSQSRNKLIASARKHVTTSELKNNILNVISKNDYVYYTNKYINNRILRKQNGYVVFNNNKIHKNSILHILNEQNTMQKNKHINGQVLNQQLSIKTEGFILRVRNVLRKYNIDKLTNSFQEKYFDGNSSGLGDFIRGSLFLMQFCETYKIHYDISLNNHKIFNFLKIGSITNIDKNDMNISKFLETNFRPYIKPNNEISFKTGSNLELVNNFIKYISYSKKLQGNTNINVYVICYPLYNEISVKHKNIIKYIFEPNDFLKQYVLEQLSIMNLFQKHYNIIHIRCGDNELLGKHINEKVYSKVYNFFNKISNIDYIGRNEQFLVISDSVNLKNILKYKYPFLKVFNNNNICHVGEGCINTSDTIKSMLTDFYFIAYSKNIFSLSVHGHGTGFSKWTSVVYDIPYKCVYIG